MIRTPLSTGQLVVDVLNSQHARTGATWRINTKILSTYRGRRHIVSPRAQLVLPALTLPIQYSSNPRLGAYCYAELAVFFSSDDRNHRPSFRLRTLTTEGWPG